MKAAEVQFMVDEIARIGSRDDEMAHSKEDDMREAVLRAIAEGTCEDPAECARVALRSGGLDFARWCA